MDDTNRRMLGLGIILLFFIGWGSIFLTHKISGPVFKLRQYFHKVEQGDLTARVKFRKFDESHSLADSFNSMTGSLDASIGKLKRVARVGSPEELKKELGKFITTSD